MADNEKKDVSLNDLEKDLNKGNEAVQEYLEKQRVKQGYFDPDVKESKLNDPKSAPKTSADLSALEVAEKAVEKKK